jgi:hypothetical protein
MDPIIELLYRDQFRRRILAEVGEKVAEEHHWRWEHPVHNRTVRLMKENDVDADATSVWLAAFDPDAPPFDPKRAKYYAAGGRLLTRRRVSWNPPGRPPRGLLGANLERALELADLDVAELRAAFTAGRHRTRTQRRALDKLAMFVTAIQPNVAALAQLLDCSRQTLYSLPAKGARMTTIERLDKLERHIDERLDETERIMLMALGMDPIREAEQALVESDESAWTESSQG